jgi:hypothetical protein
MAYQLSNPILSAYKLTELDETGEAEVTFRQATVGQIQERERLIYGNQSRTYTDSGMRIERNVVRSVQAEIEVRLTIAGCKALYDADGSDLFKFKPDGTLDMTPDQFHKVWKRLPPLLAGILYGHCLDSNPDWDFRIDPNAVAENETE